MAAPVELTADEQAEVIAGRCACGCGETRPSGSSRWAGTAHSQRHYRRRLQAGRVTSFADRRKAADLARADELDARATEHTAEAKRQRTAATGARREARRLRSRHAGQEELPLPDHVAA